MKEENVWFTLIVSVFVLFMSIAYFNYKKEQHMIARGLCWLPVMGSQNKIMGYCR